MSCLPEHGRVDCSACFASSPTFDTTYREEGGWRIKANPLAWGNRNPAVVVLGFSKGQTQSGALAREPHDSIAFKKARPKVGKIMRRIGLLKAEDRELSYRVDRMISDRDGLFHFGSLIRCSVERYDQKKGWVATGGGMLDNFVATPFGQQIAANCSTRFLGDLPSSVKLVVMFGMGEKRGYVAAAKTLIEQARGTNMTWFNDVTYEDDGVVVVHVEHFGSRGSLLPQWLGEGDHKGCPRSEYSAMATKGVLHALSR